MPPTAIADVTRSNTRARLTAAPIAAGNVTRSATMTELPTSSSVAGTRSPIRCATGRPSLKL